MPPLNISRILQKAYGDATTDKVSEAFDKVNDNFDAAKVMIDDHETRISTNETLPGRMDTAETNITSLDTRLDTAETDITSLDSRVDTAEGSITSHGTRLTTAEGLITQHGTRLTDAETDIIENADRISKLDGVQINVCDPVYGASTSATAAANTTAFNAAFLAAAAAGKSVIIPAGRYKTEGTLNLGTSNPNAPKALTILAEPGAIIEHNPLNDTTDCIAIIGLDGGRTVIRGLTIEGTATFGRDLIRIGKGDYVTLWDVKLENAKRDAFQVRPTVSSHWIENLLLVNVKVQTAGRDGFHFELSGSATLTFCNQILMMNCETRSVARHSLMLQNDVTHNNSAQKISNLRIINMEFGASPGPEAIIRFQGSPGVAPIENISIQDSAVEDTAALRAGWGVEITGKMSGKLTFENTIVYGIQASRVLFVDSPCTSDGNITVTIDRTDGDPEVYLVPVTAAAHNTPALVAAALADFAYPSTPDTHRAVVSGDPHFQSVTFSESDKLTPTVTVDFGTTGVTGKISTPGAFKGAYLFPMANVEDSNSAATLPIYATHMGLYKKIRTTAALAAATGGAGTGGTADVHTLAAGEILEGFILERFNANENEFFHGRFTTYGKMVDLEKGLNVNAMNADAKSLFISARCSTNGSIVITLDGTPFVIPVHAAVHTTPDLVADKIQDFDFGAFRCMRSSTQTVVFSKADGTQFSTFDVAYGSTGVTGGTPTNVKVLRVRNDHINTQATLEVFLRRAVKDSSS